MAFDCTHGLRPFVPSPKCSAVKVTADDIAQLLASSPPRRVPAQVRKAATGGRGSWGVVLFGLIFGGMGLVFTAFFFPWHFWDDWRLAGAVAATTMGVVQHVRETNMTINDTRVMAYDFRYTPANEQAASGHCYTTGSEWHEGAQVTVRYLPAQPELACIEGARLNEAG